MKTTDYVEGASPLGLGTRVEYFWAPRPGIAYVVTGVAEPLNWLGVEEGSLHRYFPDGVAYEICPVSSECGFGNRDQMVYNVRRLSLQVLKEESMAKEDKYKFSNDHTPQPHGHVGRSSPVPGGDTGGHDGTDTDRWGRQSKPKKKMPEVLKKVFKQPWE